MPALLGYLVLNPGPQSREQVADALWPDGDRERARHNLRQTLLYLKQMLEPDADGLFVASRSQLGLNAENHESDVGQLLATEQPLEFDHKCEVCDLAVKSYRGDFLPGVEDDWAQEARSRLAHLYYRALIFLADAMLTANPAQSLAYAQRAVEEEPLQDGARARKIRALVALGEKAAAQLEYEAFALLLDDELGMTPAEIVTEALDGASTKSANLALAKDGAGTVNDLQFALESLKASNRPQDAVDLAIALTPHYLNRGSPSVGLSYLEEALSRAGSTISPEKEAHAALCRAQLYMARGDVNAASTLLDGLLERKSDLGKALYGQTLLLQSHVSLAKGEGKRSSGSASEAFESGEKALNKSLQLDALLVLSIGEIAEARFKEGLEYANRALEIGTELGETTSIASALIRKAYSLENLNRPAESESCARRAAKLLSGVESARATSLRVDIARLMEDLGKLADAEAGYRQCISEYGVVESKFREMVAKTYLGDILHSRGKSEEAAAIHREVLAERRKMNLKPGIATSLRGLGLALIDLGSFDEAREALLESAHLYLNDDLQPEYASVLAALANLEAKAGNVKLALRLASRASQMLRGMTVTERKEIGRSGLTLLGEMEALIRVHSATG